MSPTALRRGALCAALAATTIASAAASQAPAGDPRPNYRAMLREAAITAEVAAPADPTGDSDSFLRNVRWLGLMSTGVEILASDCSPDAIGELGPDDHCFPTDATPGVVTNATIADAAHITIPARSANSLFCQWQTSVVSWTFFNPTPDVRTGARIVATPSYTFTNPVLATPGLINAQTGLPFNGSLTVTLPGIRHQRSLQPGEAATERENLSRVCIGGLVSKRALVDDYGLTATQAANFFKAETGVVMSLQLSGSFVDFATIIYGTRFVGD